MQDHGATNLVLGRDPLPGLLMAAFSCAYVVEREKESGGGGERERKERKRASSLLTRTPISL